MEWKLAALSENSCGQCSQDKTSQAKEKDALILPLLSCRKNHIRSAGETDAESEIDLNFSA